MTTTRTVKIIRQGGLIGEPEGGKIQSLVGWGQWKKVGWEGDPLADCRNSEETQTESQHYYMYSYPEKFA